MFPLEKDERGLSIRQIGQVLRPPPSPEPVIDILTDPELENDHLICGSS